MTSLFDILIFSLGMHIPPGPVNIISASLGKKKGFFDSVGFLIGAAIGSTVLAVILGLEHIDAFQDYPQLANIPKYIGSFYMIVAAFYMIFDVDFVFERGFGYKILDGFFIQWINPKSWICTLTGISKFNSNNETLLFYLVIEFLVICFGVALWSYAGELTSKAFSSDKQQKILNVILGLSLAAFTIHLFITV